jgi:hypothetical protein
VPITGRRPVHPVRGKVYYEGTPVVNAQVVFDPLNPDSKRVTRGGDGMTEADGGFALTTYVANDGTPAGDYAVTVAWSNGATDGNGRPGPNLLPERYARPDTTPMKATVKAGSNEVVLEMKK